MTTRKGDPFIKSEAFLFHRKVDSVILHILRDRWSKCVLYQGPDKEVCEPLYKIYKDGEEAWFSKCEFSLSYSSSLYFWVIFSSCGVNLNK